MQSWCRRIGAISGIATPQYCYDILRFHDQGKFFKLVIDLKLNILSLFQYLFLGLRC